LKLWIFPTGAHYTGPNDSLEQRAASCLLSISPTRQRLIEGAYQSTDPDDPLGRVESAFLKVIANSDAEQRVHRAQRSGDLQPGPVTPELLQQASDAALLSDAEVAHYLQTLAAVDDAIQVDHYRPAKKPTH